LVNEEKHACHVNLSHIEEVSSDEEEIKVPATSVPLALSSLLPLPTLGTLLYYVSPGLPFPQVVPPPEVLAHIPSLQDAQATIPHATILSPLPITPQLPMSANDWALFINKFQSGELPSITITSHSISPQTVPALATLPPEKVFMAETATFVLNSDPAALPDCLIQMALNKVFIPLSMLKNTSLNKIEHNEAKFK